MTETEWLKADVSTMLRFVSGQDRGHLGRFISWLGLRSELTSPRKLRLVACAWCRANPKATRSPALRQALDVSERFGDGLANWDELNAAVERVQRSHPPTEGFLSSLAATAATICATITQDHEAQTPLEFVAKNVENAYIGNLTTRVTLDEGEQASVRKEVDLGQLFRHIVGNPFRPYRISTGWHAAVIALAEAVYQGDAEAQYPLQDALLEAGHRQLAAHFAEETVHPKSCWVIDLLTGRQ